MSKSIEIPVVSKSGVLIFILFTLFLIAVRLLYPVGDEPDFSIRAPRVLFGEHPWWSPYYMLSGFLKEIDLYSECKVDAGAFSLWASIDASCYDSINNIIIRVVTTLFVSLPLWLIIVFPRVLKVSYNLFNINISNKDIVNRINIMSVCLVFPGTLYYIGVLAEEQFVLVLGLLSFFFVESIIVTIVIGIVIFSVDIGNSLIFILFYFVINILTTGFISKLLKYKKIFLIVLLLLLLLSSIIGVEVFLNRLMLVGSFEDKAESIANAFSNSDLLNKYPVYLRPIITYMSSILSLPSGIKNIFSIFLSFLLFIYLFVIFFKRKDVVGLKTNVIYLYSSIGVILAFVILLPTYANAKYYIFLLPFILKPLLFNVQLPRMVIAISFLSMTNFILLFLYRL